MRIDAVQSTPAVNQSHASKNISILIMDSSFPNQNFPPTCRIYHNKWAILHYNIVIITA